MVATETIGNVVAGDISAKELIINYALTLRRQGYAETTIKSRVSILTTLAKRGVNLNDSDSVKDGIANQTWCNKRKINAIDAYSCLLTFQGRTWDPPKYRFTTNLPFIPKESELDDLIAGCGPKTSTLLLLLKETGIRVGEAHHLKWTDIDHESKTIRVSPEKGSNPRIAKVSDKLLNMLSVIRAHNLVQDKDRIFSHDVNTMRDVFLKQRKNLARKLQNPRLNQIHFHTFRHWKATTLYHKTKDLLYVQRFLGHRSISNTMKYIQLEESIFKENVDEYICKAAKTIQEASEYIKQGFTYVCDVEDAKLFRKPK